VGDDAGTVNETGQILLIADDENASRHYRGALEAAGYAVTQTESFVDTLGAPASEPDLIVLCQLAALAYPGQAAPVLRIPERMTPDDLVVQVHRKIALRATLLSTAIQSAA
jgi:DNA-binding NtrC family response regulator